MVIYDFCKTLVINNSLDDFILFVLKSENKKYSQFVFKLMNSFIFKVFQKLGFLSNKKKKELKINLLSGLRKKKIKKYSNEFAELLYSHYLNSVVFEHFKEDTSKYSVVIISAGLDCYISEFIKRTGLNVSLISNILVFDNDICQGRLVGEDCYGHEKVVLFNKLYGGSQVYKTYSDCLSDKPIFNLASKKYLVNIDCVKEIQL